MSGTELQQQETQSKQFEPSPAETKQASAAPADSKEANHPHVDEHKKKGGVGGWMKKTFVRKPNDGFPNQKEYSWEPPHPRYKS